MPLHPFIVDDLQFPRHLEHLKATKKARVFQELKRQSNRFGHYPSRWFGNYKRSVGIESKKKTFHSFRHSFQDNLKQQLVAQSIVDELVGHKIPGESFGRYGKPYLAKIRYEEALLKLDFGIDLSHLKQSKWVPK